MERMAPFHRLKRLFLGRRSAADGPRVLVVTDEHGSVTVLPAPESLEFWRQCPWAGDDAESVEFRRIMERDLG